MWRFLVNFVDFLGHSFLCSLKMLRYELGFGLVVFGRLDLIKTLGYFQTFFKKDKKKLVWHIIMYTYSWIGRPIRADKKINMPANQKGYDTFETTVGKLSARRIQICCDYFCLGIILKKEVENKSYKNSQSRFGFSSPRAFQRQFRNCRSPFWFFQHYLFVCV